MRSRQVRPAWVLAAVTIAMLASCAEKIMTTTLGQPGQCGFLFDTHPCVGFAVQATALGPIKGTTVALYPVSDSGFNDAVEWTVSLRGRMAQMQNSVVRVYGTAGLARSLCAIDPLAASGLYREAIASLFILGDGAFGERGVITVTHHQGGGLQLMIADPGGRLPRRAPAGRHGIIFDGVGQVRISSFGRRLSPNGAAAPINSGRAVDNVSF